MEPWYKVVLPRQEVREGRSFNPDEFAIALEQVVAGAAPSDYQDSTQFFSRTCFTRALKEHTGMVLRRLAGKTENNAPVLTLVTQFGGGKTHTLTALYHLIKDGEKLARHQGISDLLKESGLAQIPKAKVAVFVGNAWDPREGRETPWIDVARQLAGNQGVAELGTAAKTTPPGTEALLRLFKAANAPVLILMDEVLNLFNRHRNLAEPCYAFFDNLNRAMTGTASGAMLISLPRSQVEMTDWDYQWQERITKMFRRSAKDLIANDEAEISEVVRRRLFEDLGSEKIRKNVARAYADWCFDRRAQLPPEWTAVDTATTEAKAREFLRSRFEACYPFHPATLSVFQRKWQALTQYQQTRGTLAMLAQWISWASRDHFEKAKTEPLITLGSAPLEVPEFRSMVLGQLGESRLNAAIETDIAGAHSHARTLDADTKGPLRDIHRRVGAVILFESSGGQVDKVAHLPELRFALGEPELDTTSIDNAALAVETRAFFIRKVGTDGFQIGYKPTLKKVVNDRKASLDEESEIKPAMRALIQKEFGRGASLPMAYFPEDGTAIPDSPKLSLIVASPDLEWTGEGRLKEQIIEWTKTRGKSPRLYPGALVWCLKKPGRDFREKIEVWLAWKRIAREISEGTLGTDFDRSDKTEILTNTQGAEETAREEVWGGFRFVLIADKDEASGLKAIDLGAGHSSSNETLCGRIITVLKSQGLLESSVGAGYIERNWPVALKEAGAWPLLSLRQSFLNGSLTRLVDPDFVLRSKIVDFVKNGDFGLASGGPRANGTYDRIWFSEQVAPEEVAFEAGVFLLAKSKAHSLKVKPAIVIPESEPPGPGPGPGPEGVTDTEPQTGRKTIHIYGFLPTEVWNKLGTKFIPKIKSGTEFKAKVDFSVSFEAKTAEHLIRELQQIIEELGLQKQLEIEIK